MESGSSTEEHSKDSTISICVWKLRRYGRFIPEGKAKPKSSASNVNCAWKIFESSESAGQLELNILASGHLLVSQGQELLEGFSLLDAQSFFENPAQSQTVCYST
ncbi:meiotic recombination protein REC114-like [Carassius auratus]|uniref:Meiotic recombination protein REC114-like n=1 Tax=Carassius auratus TaxID=7957 RepID=A0A6P6NSX9_CARAU|nr:meiotic recombination protein REC114-like [Carassius auratus]